MTESNILKKIISYNKPISLEKYINLCLFGTDGYYKNSNVIGKFGDFITAPEISQLFGEIIGLFIADLWQNNIKKSFNLIELGPGKGTLLLDILNITNRYKIFQQSLNIHLIEKNIKLINIQKNNLSKHGIDIKKINWLKNFNIENNKPIFVIANEFFDCFPIKQFYKKKDVWYEKMVEYKENTQNLGFIDCIVQDSKSLANIKTYKTIDILEFSKSRENYFLKICQHLKKFGGVMISIDYGYFNMPSNFTLQSINNNKKSNILSDMGSQDITALVDFKKLIEIARSQKLNIHTFVTQRDFFIKYGIYELSEKIMNNISESKKIVIKEGLDRIIDKDNMGTLFKVLIISKL